MDLVKLSAILREQAVNLSACNEGLADFSQVTDLHSTLKLYKHYAQFCLENNFPSLDVIQENFDAKLLQFYGIYNRYRGIIKANNGTYVIRQSHIDVTVGQMQAALIRTRDSDLNITVNAYGDLTLQVYNGGKYNINALTNSRAVVFDYSNGTAKIATEGKVKLFIKNKQ